MSLKKCDQFANYRYTWPGNDETVCCFVHHDQVLKISDAIGMHLQLIPLSESDIRLGLKCSSNVEDKDV